MILADDEAVVNGEQELYELRVFEVVQQETACSLGLAVRQGICEGQCTRSDQPSTASSVSVEMSELGAGRSLEQVTAQPAYGCSG